MNDQGYGGDVDVEAAWRILSDDADAVLVDVRTRPEWAFVGVPDLSPLGKRVVLVEWQTYPASAPNPAFANELAAQGVTPDRTVLFLCRSGQRSRAAAIAMTGRGYATCLNVAGGFEGPHDDRGRRGTVDGWKAKGLPWNQQ